MPQVQGPAPSDAPSAAAVTAAELPWLPQPSAQEPLHDTLQLRCHQALVCWDVLLHYLLPHKRKHRCHHCSQLNHVFLQHVTPGLHLLGVRTQVHQLLLQLFTCGLRVQGVLSRSYRQAGHRASGWSKHVIVEPPGSSQALTSQPLPHIRVTACRRLQTAAAAAGKGLREHSGSTYAQRETIWWQQLYSHAHMCEELDFQGASCACVLALARLVCGDTCRHTQHTLMILLGPLGFALCWQTDCLYKAPALPDASGVQQSS